MIFMGQASLRRAVAEYMDDYHENATIRALKTD